MKIGSVSQSYSLFTHLTIGQLGHQESLGLLMGILVYLLYEHACYEVEWMSGDCKTDISGYSQRWHCFRFHGTSFGFKSNSLYYYILSIFSLRKEYIYSKLKVSTYGYENSLNFHSDYLCQPLSTQSIRYNHLCLWRLRNFNADYPEAYSFDIPKSGVSKEKEAVSGLLFYALQVYLLCIFFRYAVGYILVVVQYLGFKIEA